MTEQIDQFFNPDGTLISIPVKLAKKLAVLRHIAADLSSNTKYPDKELNAIIVTTKTQPHYSGGWSSGESFYWVTVKS